MTDLQRAIKDLGASRVHSGEYAYVGNDEGASCAYVVDAADMRDYGARLRRGQPDAYSLWCAATMAQRMTHFDAVRLGLL